MKVTLTDLSCGMLYIKKFYIIFDDNDDATEECANGVEHLHDKTFLFTKTHINPF